MYPYFIIFSPRHRFDHAPFFSMQKSEYTIPFYVKEDKSKAAAAEKKSWVNKSFTKKFSLRNFFLHKINFFVGNNYFAVDFFVVAKRFFCN